MIEFRILGSIVLRAADGSEFRSVISQPKRLALLAYLALSPGVFHRRDTLLALFWPELDQQRGRAALRQALYHLRRALGSDVLIARGDDELGVDPARLWCDAAAFLQALVERRFHDAVELHRGELLSGLFVDQALELERWIDEKRSRLRLAAAKAAWEVADAEERAGNPSSAVTWARHAVELGPDDEDSVRRLITLLARTGDRAGALRAYHDLARRLEREYEAEPSATTQALIAQVRATGPERGLAGGSDQRSDRERREPIGTAAVSSVGSGAGRGTGHESPGEYSTIIAVLPFTFRGQHELDYLGEGMADLLGLAIDGVDSLYSIEPRVLLTWLRRGEQGLADIELCRAIGERFGADLCVMGGIVQAGDRLRAHAAVYDVAAPEEPRVRVAAESGVDEVFALADRLAAELLIHGAGASGSMLTRIAAMTTTSLPALKAYLNGEQAFRAGRFTPAVEAFQLAIVEDPCFALAHYRLATLAEWAGILPLARASAVHALEDADRLPVNDRRLLEALHAYFEGDFSTAEFRYREVLASCPDSAEAWAQLAKLYYYLNSLRGRRLTDAREPLERAHSLDPGNIITLVHLAIMAAKEGRLDEVDSIIRQVLELQRQGDYIDFPVILRVLRAFALEDSEEEARLWRELESSNEFTLFWSFVILTLLLADLDAASRVASLMTQSTRPPLVQLFGRLTRAELELAQGRWSRAQGELDIAARLNPGTTAVYRGMLALASFRDPEPDELRLLLDDLLAAPCDWIEPDPLLAPWFTAHTEVLESTRIYLIGLLHTRLGDLVLAESCAAELDRMAGTFAQVAHARDAACGIRAFQALVRGEHPAEVLAWLDRCQLAAPTHAYIPSLLYGRLHERWLRAEQLAKLGRDDEAETWYAALGEDSPHGFIFLAASHLRRAQLLESRGECEGARRGYKSFVQLWHECDPELQPLVTDAAARLEELAHAVAPGPAGP